jgi:hypothetical protein
MVCKSMKRKKGPAHARAEPFYLTFYHAKVALLQGTPLSHSSDNENKFRNPVMGDNES